MSPAFLEAFCKSKHRCMQHEGMVQTYIHGVASGRLLAGVAFGKSLMTS